MPLDPASPSPKRKRDEPIHPPPSRIAPIRLGPLCENSILPLDEDVADAVESPRSAVAQKLEDLEIVGSARVSRLVLLGSSQLDGNAARKKPKFALNEVSEIPETPHASYSNANSTRIADSTQGSLLGTRLDQVIFTGDNTAHTSTTPDTTPTRRSNHQARRTPSPNSPSQRFYSQPPYSGIASEIAPSSEPVSLHWEDSEITGHDPSDPEDDGEGINGLGFKPTAAIARSRSERRRKQLAEYKSREDKEARETRAKRIAQRRQGGTSVATKAPENDGAEKERRVRFSQAERAVDVL